MLADTNGQKVPYFVSQTSSVPEKFLLAATRLREEAVGAFFDDRPDTADTLMSRSLALEWDACRLMVPPGR